VPGGIIEPNRHWKKKRSGFPECDLDARLTTLLCKKEDTAAKSKEVKTAWPNSFE
jgi:hypothetical protein